MLDTVDSTESAFLNGFKAEIGKRVRTWYIVDSADGAPVREVAEGRLTTVDCDVILEESRAVHPFACDDHARRTTSVASLLGYAALDQRTGGVANTVLRGKRTSLQLW